MIATIQILAAFRLFFSSNIKVKKYIQGKKMYLSKQLEMKIHPDTAYLLIFSMII